MQTMPNSPADTLQAELACARQLLDILKREQQILIDAGIDQLVTLTEEKSSTVTQMMAYANQRHRLLGNYGYSVNESGMQRWIEHQPTSVRDISGKKTSTLHALWLELLDKARIAKELNRTNGMLINKHVSNNQNALNILHNAHSVGNFYGPDGQSTSTTASRGFVIG